MNYPVKIGDFVICINEFWNKDQKNWWPPEYVNQICQIISFCDQRVHLKPISKKLIAYRKKQFSLKDNEDDYFESASEGLYPMIAMNNKLFKLVTKNA